jgi:outer membrane protein assembly factor BamB
MVAPLVLGELLCIAGRNGQLSVVELDGTVKWKHSLPAGCHSPPVAADGLLVVGCDDGKFYAFREK